MSENEQIALSRQGDATLVVHIGGTWTLRGGLPSAAPVVEALATEPLPTRLVFEANAVETWDSSLLVFASRVESACRERNVETDSGGLPAGARRLLALAEAVPEREDAKADDAEQPFLDRVGELTLSAGSSLNLVFEFLGETVLGVGRWAVGRSKFRSQDLLYLTQQSGAEALGIVALVSFLLGVILAFVGAIQLEQFGAAIFVADLVGIAMVRDMGALITGIAMAGRSGAAFAAQLGSMKVSQEIDALSTAGISPVQFLVVPRIIALVLMMPLLTLFADALGVLGGMTIGTTLLDLSFTTYAQQTTQAIGVDDLMGGIVKAGTYGVLIAMAGCLRGMQARKSSAGVGDAATSAVVTSIVAIIAASGLFQFMFYELGW